MGGVPVKHRKIRRVNPAGVSGVRRNAGGSGVCSFCHRRRGRTSCDPRRLSRLSFKRRMPECQSGDVGAIPTDRTNFSKTRRAPARAAESPKLCQLGAAPRRRANFNCGEAKWEGSGLISRLRAGSIPAPANHFPGLLDHSGGHPPCKRESTVQSRGGPPFSKSQRTVSSRLCSLSTERMGRDLTAD